MVCLDFCACSRDPVWILAIFAYLSVRESPHQLSADTINGFIEPEKGIRELCSNLVGSYVFHLDDQGGLSEPLSLCKITLSVESSEGGTRLVSQLDMKRLVRVMSAIMVFLVLFLEPLFLFGIALLVWFFAASSSVPALRWQTFQILQIIHVLWPPFLIYFLFTRFRKEAKGKVESLHTLFEMIE